MTSTLPNNADACPEAVRTLGSLLSDGHRTYVHCTAGINRAPLVVLAYLTFVEGMAIDDAIALIHEARREASPYWDAYHRCGLCKSQLI